MREDWDFVSFGNYSKDMDELALLSRSVTEKLIKEKNDLINLIGAMAAKYGTVIINQDTIMYGSPPFEVHRDECNRTFVIESKK